MKTLKGTIIFLMVIAMMMSATQSALAGRSGKEIPGGEGPFVTDPQASGETFNVTLGLYYEKFDCDTNCPEDPIIGPIAPDTNMTFFMRLETTKNLFSFGGVALHVCYWDFISQQAAIEDYIKTVVIPYLAGQGVIDNPAACFAIKSASKVVENVGASFVTDTPVYTLMDIVIAIDRKNSCP